jgi:hypothetical protein
MQKIPINGHAANLRFDGVCKVKNRLIGDFWRFYARSTTNSQGAQYQDHGLYPQGKASEPTPPMVMPISLRASTGATLMPSPGAFRVHFPFFYKFFYRLPAFDLAALSALYFSREEAEILYFQMFRLWS